MSELINEFVRKFNFLKRFPLFGKDLFIVCQKVNRKHCVKSVDIGSFSGRNTGKYGPEKLQMWNLFTQWKSLGFDPFCAGIRIYSNTFQYSTTFAETSKGIGTFARNGSLVTTYFVSFCTHCTKKMKFSIREFFSICEQTRKKLQIWPHLLKKLLMENFIFWCSV